MQTERIRDIEVLLGYTFRSKPYLINALSHSSIKNESRPSNERLEFLGDSVLGMIISDALYRRYAESDEGTLTRIKSQAVSRATLQRVAQAMGLDRYILVGKGVAKREIPASLLGNLFEAIVGAIYLDAGLAASRKFVLRHLDVVIDEIVHDRAERNYKSMLQHHCQREMQAVPAYRVLREAGPAHHRHFDVAVLVGGREYGRARADSKKEAEQGAARAAMIHFKAVDENAHKPARGAGQILRVGPESSRKSRRGRSGRRKEAADAPKAPPVPVEDGPKPSHAPGADAVSSRRSPRRRRTSADDKAASEPVRKKRAAKKKKKQTGQQTTAAAGEAPSAGKKKRSTRRKKKTPAVERSAPAGTAPRAKKKRRSRRRKASPPDDGGT